MDEEYAGLLDRMSRNIIDDTKGRMSPMEEAGFQVWRQQHDMYDSDDYNTFEVDGISDVGALEGHCARNVKKCLESIDGGMKPTELSAFFKNLVHTF